MPSIDDATNTFDIETTGTLQVDTIAEATAANGIDVSHEGTVIKGVAINVTRTVGSGKDHATIQDAVDWFDGKICVNCTIVVDAGTYNENVTVDSCTTVAPGNLTLKGDVRSFAGFSYVHGSTEGNERGTTNLGSGAVTLSNSGNDVTVACATTNPDLQTLGLVNGDTLLIYDGSTSTEYTVSSVATNVITLTGTAPTLGSNGDAITFLPDRKINASSGTALSVLSRCIVQGFDIDGPSGTTYPMTVVGTFVQIDHLVVRDGYYLLVSRGGAAQALGPVTLTDMTGGVRSSGSYFDCQDDTFAINTTTGFLAEFGGNFFMLSCTAASNTNGHFATVGSTIRADGNHAINNTTGYFAKRNGTIQAVSSNTNNVGNSTNYSPATSDVEGNQSSIIFWS